MTYPPATPAAPEKPFWADAIGMAGFGLVGLQWLMSDMLHLRAVALASSTSMILYNMRAVGKPLVDKTLRNPNPTPTLAAPTLALTLTLTLQWIPVCANVAFIAINSVQIAIILRERQDITLEP